VEHKARVLGGRFVGFPHGHAKRQSPLRGGNTRPVGLTYSPSGSDLLAEWVRPTRPVGQRCIAKVASGKIIAEGGW
jgi:hypothetical protein